MVCGQLHPWYLFNMWLGPEKRKSLVPARNQIFTMHPQFLAIPAASYTSFKECTFISTYEIYLIMITFPEHKNNETILYICMTNVNMEV
jgi:hypothetical protein